MVNLLGKHLNETVFNFLYRCYISRKNLSAAISHFADQYNFTVISKPFVLDPSISAGGIPWYEQLTMKQGEKVAKQEIKGNGPISKAGKSIVRTSCFHYHLSFPTSFLTFRRMGISQNERNNNLLSQDG